MKSAPARLTVGSILFDCTNRQLRCQQGAWKNALSIDTSLLCLDTLSFTLAFASAVYPTFNLESSELFLALSLTSATSDHAHISDHALAASRSSSGIVLGRTVKIRGTG